MRNHPLHVGSAVQCLHWCKRCRLIDTSGNFQLAAQHVACTTGADNVYASHAAISDARLPDVLPSHVGVNTLRQTPQHANALQESCNQRLHPYEPTYSKVRVLVHGWLLLFETTTMCMCMCKSKSMTCSHTRQCSRDGAVRSASSGIMHGQSPTMHTQHAQQCGKTG
jgi:hypothetical protein